MPIIAALAVLLLALASGGVVAQDWTQCALALLALQITPPMHLLPASLLAVVAAARLSHLAGVTSLVTPERSAARGTRRALQEMQGPYRRREPGNDCDTRGGSWHIWRDR
jgi:hypothetical protein